MNQVRRSFLINTSLVLSGVALFPQTVLAKQKHKGFVAQIGVCTPASNNKLLASCGYSYIEENCQNFLVPEKSKDFKNTGSNLLQFPPRNFKKCRR